jgi:lipoyl(octanoyl) transferase
MHPGPRSRSARAVWLGRRPYGAVHDLQKQLLAARTAQAVGDTILLVEHEPVVTLGRAADPRNVVATPALLAAAGVSVEHVGRGGDVTYHGPGQLVGYPILDLRPDRCDVRKYVRSLAEIMVRLARDAHVEAGTVDGMIGVWADLEAPQIWGGEAFAQHPAKVGAIGVKISRWVTMHGFALNLDVDFGHFALIVPCGIVGHPVASLASLGGSPRSVRETALSSGPILADVLDLTVAGVEDLEGVSTAALGGLLVGDAAGREARYDGPAHDPLPAG